LEVPVRRTLRILAGLGLVALLAVIVKRLVDRANNPDGPAVAPWEALRDDDAPATSAPEPVAVEADWAEPNPDGSCPAAFPIKAKLSSKIFHVPGGGSYERTQADRCYLNEASAEADGLRQAKR
jgi:hypothetical protein